MALPLMGKCNAVLFLGSTWTTLSSSRDACRGMLTLNLKSNSGLNVPWQTHSKSGPAPDWATEAPWQSYAFQTLQQHQLWEWGGVMELEKASLDKMNPLTIFSLVKAHVSEHLYMTPTEFSSINQKNMATLLYLTSCNSTDLSTKNRYIKVQPEHLSLVVIRFKSYPTASQTFK